MNKEASTEEFPTGEIVERCYAVTGAVSFFQRMEQEYQGTAKAAVAKKYAIEALQGLRKAMGAEGSGEAGKADNSDEIKSVLRWFNPDERDKSIINETVRRIQIVTKSLPSEAGKTERGAARECFVKFSAHGDVIGHSNSGPFVGENSEWVRMREFLPSAPSQRHSVPAKFVDGGKLKPRGYEIEDSQPPATAPGGTIRAEMGDELSAEEELAFIPDPENGSDK